MAKPFRPSLVLASASPRRRRLLISHGYAIAVAPADIEEIAPKHLSPGEIVLWNARAKARAIGPREPKAIVVGVDTLVSFEGRIFGKPAHLDEAYEMLRRLNGTTHEVFSGVWCVQWQRGREHGFVEVTRVHFHRRSEQELRTYLNRIGPLDKAGAYAAQDDRGEMIREIEGSFTNVIGLPMEQLETQLQVFRKRAQQKATTRDRTPALGISGPLA